MQPKYIRLSIQFGGMTLNLSNLYQRVCRSVMALSFGVMAIAASADDDQPSLKQKPAASKPLWQLGVGFGALSTPYYLGADTSQTTALPTLVPIYRGRFLKMDEQGLRSDLIDSDHWELDMSFDGVLGVPSDEVTVRQGMPDLAPVAQAGPSLVYRFDRENNNPWAIELALRLGASLDFDERKVDYQGIVLNPKIIHEVTSQSLFKSVFNGDGLWRFKSSLGPLWASERNNAYYYQVESEFATDTRAAYQAKAGYSGWRFQSSVSYFSSNWLVGLFTRYENTDGSVNEGSPLLQETHNFSVGVAATYFFGSSKARVN